MHSMLASGKVFHAELAVVQHGKARLKNAFWWWVHIYKIEHHEIMSIIGLSLIGIILIVHYALPPQSLVVLLSQCSAAVVPQGLASAKVWSRCHSLVSPKRLDKD